MQPNTLKLLEQCVETGLKLGWNRAYKHGGNPPQEYVQEQQFDAILNEIHEWFNFPDSNANI